MFGSNNKSTPSCCLHYALVFSLLSFSLLVFPSQIRLEIPNTKKTSHMHFSKQISSGLDSMHRTGPPNSSCGRIDSNHVSLSEGDRGGLAQEKTSDPLLNSTLFCSMEELQGGVWVCGWGVAYLLFALLLECNKKFSAQSGSSCVCGGVIERHSIR